MVALLLWLHTTDMPRAEIRVALKERVFRAKIPRVCGPGDVLLAADSAGYGF